LIAIIRIATGNSGFQGGSMSNNSIVLHRNVVGETIRRVLLASACGFIATTASVAQAADAEVDGLDQVVVTGTRLGQTGFSTPTPVTVIDGAAMQDMGITNAGVAINQLPSFRATTTPTTNGWGSFNVGAQVMNLRGLGASRNLVLVDGRRAPPVTKEGTVDLNMIPSGLVQRIDVVTGGASAQYGSDAIAGAINVMLDHSLNGIKGAVDYGVTDEGDGEGWHVELAGGGSFADGRGHFLLGGEWSKEGGVGTCFTRSYCKGGVMISNSRNPASGGIPGLPANLRFNEGGGYFANTNGVVTWLNNPAAAQAVYDLFGTRSITFTDDGTPIPYILGNPTGGLSTVGDAATSGMTFAELQVPVERYATFGHAYLDVTDNLRLFVEGSYNNVDGEVIQARYFNGNTKFSEIYADNPFIPAALRAVIGPISATPSGTRPTASTFNLSILGQRRGFSQSEATSYRVATGFDWKLGERWNADGYYQYARTDRFQSVENAVVTGAPLLVNQPGNAGLSNPNSFAYLSWALDAVYDPADAALPEAQRDIICRATISPDAALRAAAAGCVPLNLFGSANTNPAALDYAFRTLEEDANITQHAVGLNLVGDVVDLWAGPLRMGIGAEFRRDSSELVHDQLANVFAYFQNYGADYSARQTVSEGYIEANLPLLTDAVAAKSLILNGAVRYADYSVSGFGGFAQRNESASFDATTWKVGLVWEPLDWLRTRITLSKDFRGPGLNERFAASAANFGTVLNPFTGQQEGPPQRTGGNPQLGPESSRTTTFGLVLQPPVIPGLSFSADYFDIKIDDTIGGAGGAQNIINRCFDGNQDMCALVTFAPDRSATEIASVSLNLQWQKLRGFDVETAYTLPLSQFGDFAGTLNFRLLATRILESASSVFDVVTENTGATGGGGPAKLVSTLFVGYANGPFQGNIQARYIGKGTMNANWYDPSDPEYADLLARNSNDTVDDNHVASFTTFTANASYRFGRDDRYQLFGQITNLFDKSPPSVPSTSAPSSATWFDLVGRRYRMGVRFEF
jgi:outer membrane receptor protein involved in Fe transport